MVFNTKNREEKATGGKEAWLSLAVESTAGPGCDHPIYLSQERGIIIFVLLMKRLGGGYNQSSRWEQISLKLCLSVRVLNCILRILSLNTGVMLDSLIPSNDFR